MERNSGIRIVGQCNGIAETRANRVSSIPAKQVPRRGGSRERGSVGRERDRERAFDPVKMRVNRIETGMDVPAFWMVVLLVVWIDGRWSADEEINK